MVKWVFGRHHGVRLCFNSILHSLQLHMCLRPPLYSLFPHDTALCSDSHCGLVATIALAPSIVPAWYTVSAHWVPKEGCGRRRRLDTGLQLPPSLAAGGDVCVHAYLSGQPRDESQLSALACFLVYHSVPAPRHLPPVGLEGNRGPSLGRACTDTSFLLSWWEAFLVSHFF